MRAHVCVPLIVLVAQVLSGVGVVEAREPERATAKRAVPPRAKPAAEAKPKARSEAHEGRHTPASGTTARDADDAAAAEGDEDLSEAELDDDDAASDIPPTPPCKTELRLSGTVYNAAAPERSMAMLHTKDDKRGAVYRAGAMVSEFEVMDVLPRGVLLRGAEGECWLRLKQDPHARPPPRRHKRKRKKRKKHKRRH